MGKKAKLFVRELTPNDAYLYMKIAHDDDIYKYVSFLEAENSYEAKNRILSCTKKYEKLYGLFDKNKRLVAVFDVTDNVTDNGATVNYFVGERYRGKNYAAAGIFLLEELLAKNYSHFFFDIHVSNTYSVAVQKKIHSELVGEQGQYYHYMYRLSV